MDHSLLPEEEVVTGEQVRLNRMRRQQCDSDFKTAFESIWEESFAKKLNRTRTLAAI